MADMMTMDPPATRAQTPLTDQIYKQPSKARLMDIVGRLEAEATSRVAKRTSLEQRWIADLEQYHGRYKETINQALVDEKRSRVFVNYTMPKTNALGARLKDLLFPTDEKNWGIGPTPVPELSEQTEMAVTQAREAQAMASQAAQMEQDAQKANVPPEEQQRMAAQTAEFEAIALAAKKEADRQTAIMEEARKRSGLMEKEINDQLTECQYQAVKRDQIDCAMKIGTGVTKGPVTGTVVRRGWKVTPEGEYELVMSSGEQPAYQGVDIWGYFPDMDATTIHNGNGDLERHLLNKKGLRNLQHLKGFDKDAIRRLLQLAPSTAAPSYLAELRNIRAASQQVTGDLYHVWEYNGPLESDDMRDLALHMLTRGDDSAILSNANEALKQADNIDVLQSINACVWFCQGEILKFAIYPYDSGETMYSVFTLVKDEASIFGYGMPSILRDPQAIINGAARAMMDNAGVSSGPQIIIDKQSIEPEDGTYELKPRKVWLAKNGITKENPPFQLFHIETRQAELERIIMLAEHFIDIMSAMPSALEGQPGDPGQNNLQTTALGTAIVHNAANVTFRAIVKNFDDDVTVPDIRRAYDWNMQFNPKKEIKGDYEVDARGSSVLLVREMQAQNLLVLALQLSASPIFGPMLRNREMLKKLLQANMISPDEVMLTDDEIDAVLAQAAQSSPEAIAAQMASDQADREDARIQGQQAHEVALHNQDNDTKKQVARAHYDAAMNTLAANLNMSVQELEAKLGVEEMRNASKERIFSAEIGAEVKMAKEGIASGGSGGYVSAKSKGSKSKEKA